MIPLIVFLGIAIIILSFSLYTYKICFHSPKKRTEDIFAPPRGDQYKALQERMNRSTRIMHETEYEPVQIISRDNLVLMGKYYHVKDGAPLILAFHGYRSPAVRDCAGAFALGLKLGFNILAVNQRAHGKSGGRVISFGIKERYDCQYWARYAVNRFGSDVPIILTGLSMGAATVLMASSLDLPDQVVCIMADSPYDSPAAIIRKVCKDVGYPPKLAYPFIWLGALLFGSFRLTESDAVTEVKKAKVPILLIHGEDDRFVPCDMSRRIYENCPDDAQLHTFEGAGHGLCYLIDHVRYEKICVDFLHSIPELKYHFDNQDRK